MLLPKNIGRSTSLLKTRCSLLPSNQFGGMSRARERNGKYSNSNVKHTEKRENGMLNSSRNFPFGRTPVSCRYNNNNFSHKHHQHQSIGT